MRIYETMFIIDPNLEDAERDDLAKRVKSWIEEKVKGNVRNFDRWGIRQLAFRVDKFTQGDYTVIVFDAEPSELKALEEMYRITPRIFRWMVFRREDLEKKEKKGEPVSEVKEEEEVSEVVENVQEQAKAEESEEKNEGEKA